VQRTNESYAAAADLVLDNRGSVAELEQTAREAVTRLARARERRRHEC